MRLIDADEIRKKAVPHTREEHGYNANIRKWAVLVGYIDDAPTVDAVPVVRCHNCKHRVVNPEELGDAYMTCGLEWGISGAVDPTAFCSYGERKDGDS